MALIAEAIGRFDDNDEAARIMAAFCDARRAGQPDEEILATLPDGARLGGKIVLAAMRALESALGRRLNLVLDPLTYLEDGVHRPDIGVGIGDRIIERIDDLGASRPQAEAISGALLGLIRALGPRRSLAIVLD